LRLNKFETYANYYNLNFRSFIGQHGDSYDRFLIRMNEMAESVNIANQCINKLFFFDKKIKNKKKIKIQKINNFLLNKKKNNLNKNSYNSMEQLISHFKY